MSDAILRNYMRKIEKVYQAGNATEHTYRSILQELLETLTPGITATNEPKRITCSAPDFIITRKQTPLGYIETKDIGLSLDQIERTDQMKRYLGSLANLILTDYVEFRWYVSGQHRMTARLAKVGTNNKLFPEAEGMTQFADLLQGFLLTQTPTVNNPKELATRMAALAQLTRNAIRLAFESEEGGGSLHTQMEGFRQVLIPDLTYERFADMYAQTICYGLFAARCNTRSGITFTREHAAYDIPKTNPFLRKMFIYIAGPDLDERIVWIVDDLAELLNRSDMAAILQDFGKRTRQEDPVVHFYETFLAQYDPKLRELRGVYYTPEPVVSYIVRSVDYLLKKDFDLAEGLADATKLKAASSDGKYNLETHKVQILDPATGTGTFLYYVVRQIYEQFKDNRGMWSSYVSEHLLPRLFGFEILMAPYAVAHLKLGLQLRETGYDFRDKERLGVYLTNTLEEEFEIGRLPFAEWLVEEATAAGNVKYDAPVMVVIGNPPYSYESANTGKWISKLIRDYYQVDGQPLGERNPKGLQDDYAKFIRFAQWRIERTGYGILAFITNHGYLDNPTFRGMRQSLIKSFDEIYVLNLHGNSKKKERALDGTKDENVFDIQQGVAIGIFIKRFKTTASSQQTTIHHADLWGLREVYENTPQGRCLIGGKYHWLANNDLATTEWTVLKPQSPFYFFVPQDTTLLAEYERGYKITNIMPINSVGIVTSRDHLAVHMAVQEAKNVLSRFITLPTEAARQNLNLGEDSRDWQVALAQADLKQTKLADKYLIKMAYRPFDVRYTYYTGHSRGFHSMPRHAVMRHMLQDNVALLTSRMTKGEQFAHVQVTKYPSEKIMMSPQTSNNSFHFPLYLYPDEKKDTLFDTDINSDAIGGRRPNLSMAFIVDLSNKLNMRFIQDGKGDLQLTFGPEDVFDYLYAVFHSPIYRSRYAEFLKIDFPCLPLTSNAVLFCELCRFGDKLVSLHLMERNLPLITRYPVEGNDVVEKVEYLQSTDKPEEGRVWINKTQYFADVPPELWEFHVGGYKVCQKWLKDRKGRTLTYDERKHYQRIVATLSETITLMEQIDGVIDEYGGWPIE